MGTLLGHGAGAATVELGPSPWVWTIDPIQLALPAFACLLYWTRASGLAERGHPVPPARRACFYAGLALVGLALASPVDALGEERLLFVHMLQHVLIGDVAALLVVLGLTGPVLRPVLALPGVGRLRSLAHPLVALPLWAAALVVLHVPLFYEAALAHSGVHALQHAAFFAAGALMWAALLEPLPGPAWFGAGPKVLFVVAARGVELVLANVFLWSAVSFYPRYDAASPLWGIDPVESQRIGGAIMMASGGALTLGAFAWLFLRWLDESERAEALAADVGAARAARAARYGRRVPGRPPEGAGT